MTKFISISDYKWDDPSNFEHVTGVSLTVPDETRSVRELYELWQSGRLGDAVRYLPGTYDDEIEDPLNYPTDLVDLHEAALASESILSLQEQRKAERLKAQEEERMNAEIERRVLERESRSVNTSTSQQ